MAILASLPRVNLFSSLPPTPPRNDQSSPSTSFSPPIPVPKYRPPSNRRRNPQNAPPENPALKLPHRRTKYYKRVKEGDVLSVDGDQSRGVVIGESGVSYLLPGAPFEFQFSYSEVPAAKPVAVREPAYLPFAPPTMPRPWTGKPPVKKKPGKKIPLFDSFSPPPPGKKGVKYVQMPGPFPMGKFPVEGRSREEVLGERLAKWEVKELIKPMLRDNRQVNLGRDGLTHNMLDLVHTHWKRRRVCKVRCLGVPTVDIANVCRALEEKTGGKVIYRAGGVIYLFRGRNYNYRTRPQYPMMLWKPAAPVYPKLIQEAPEGLTKAEADELREKGKRLLPIRKIAKNGVYLTLVRDVRTAFEGCPLVKLNCKGLHASDYKKLGAKLKELVPCVLLSFDDEQILMWRGQNWKSRYPIPPLPLDIVNPYHDTGESKGDCSEPDLNQVVSSPKIMSLWKRAIDSNKARLLEELDLAPDALLKKVEEFESISQAADHSYQALVVSTEDVADSGMATTETDSSSVNLDEGPTYEYDEDDSPENADPMVPLGSLPIDRLTEKLRFKRIGRED